MNATRILIVSSVNATGADAQPPGAGTPVEVPAMQIAQGRLGDHGYVVWIEGVPEGDAEHWTMTYRVRRDDQILREFTTEHTWNVFGLDRIAIEAAAAGFTSDKLTDQCAVLTRR